MKSILIVALLFSGSVFAQEVEKISVVPVNTMGSSDFNERDEWDQTGQFCYKQSDEDAEQTCATITTMGEIKVRDNGEFSSDPQAQQYIESLSSEARSVAEKYETLYVRYLALENSTEFVVHVHFSILGTTETIFVFGNIAEEESRREVELTSYSYAPLNILPVRDEQGLIQVGGEVVETFLNTSGAVELSNP